MFINLTTKCFPSTIINILVKVSYSSGCCLKHMSNQNIFLNGQTLFSIWPYKEMISSKPQKTETHEGVHQQLPPQKLIISTYSIIIPILAPLEPRRALIAGKQLPSSITIIYHHFAEFECRERSVNSPAKGGGISGTYEGSRWNTPAESFII